MRAGKLLGGLGRLLIWTGSIILLFVAYQLWGTNYAEAQAQDDLESQFEDLVGQTTTTIEPEPDSEPDTIEPTTTTTTRPPPPPDDGEAAARIVIPAIGVDKIVVEGVGRGDLRKGPGHYPGTPLPGQPGNAAIAGHRTTYGAPFHRIDELEAGAEILVTTQQGSFTYRVTGTEIVSPAAVEVIEDQGDDRLTLTSCHPKYSARQRIVLSAELVDEPAPAPPPVAEPDAGSDDESSDDPDDAAADDPDDDSDDEAPAATQDLEVLDGEERGPIGPAVAWGAVVLAVWILFYVLSRRWRRWPSYVVGAPVFAVALFVFFEAVAETLPANF